jgi:hypothetical protein
MARALPAGIGGGVPTRLELGMLIRTVLRLAAVRRRPRSRPDTVLSKAD